MGRAQGKKMDPYEYVNIFGFYNFRSFSYDGMGKTPTLMKSSIKNPIEYADFRQGA